ncbi:hypothetical protein BJ138DRAFT_1150703 [Hygrophoropsis aurantiaca]|uniref:Uncharacterized protein n=1 Tax=Hygrophoropsis aurantiaca TaxID=72124 RepID=A0ACB8AEB9_9AGAM|nr:hypothetical protein BJ138DRAFT_1150703 [Hygrophoropsis aurantiaca]
MAQGPPTPPPMSATELQDEARDSSITDTPTPLDAPPPASSNDPTQTDPSQDIYQQLFPRIVDLVSRGDFVEITRIAESRDLNTDGDRNYSRLLLIAPLILSYLVLDDLAPAQFALTRLPDNLASHPLSKLFMALVASSSYRKYESIYAQARNLCVMSQQHDFLDPSLAKTVVSMVTTFIDAFRRRTFALLSRAYASLPLSTAQIYLGVNHDEILSVVRDSSWRYDASTQMLYPTPQNATTAVASLPSALSTFHLVTNGLTSLES